MDTAELPTPLAKARLLAGDIAAAGDEIERTRRIPKTLLDKLHEARLCRMLLPRSVDGDEIDPGAYLLTIEEISRHDASVGWNLFVTNSAALLAPHMPAETAQTIFGEGCHHGSGGPAASCGHGLTTCTTCTPAAWPTRRGRLVVQTTAYTGLAELPAEEERDDWLPRVRSLDGFDDQRLSSLHGRLIALGWLGFEVGDRNTGMRYRLTREGQRVLDGLVPIPPLQVVTEEPQDELLPDRPVETTSESEDVVGELEPAEA